MYKILRDIASVTAEEPRDLIDDMGYTISTDVAEWCIRQWLTGCPLVMPSKSFNVAVIYSRLLVSHFGGVPEDYLKDSSLLAGDRFFVPYDQAKPLYDWLLSIIDLNSIVTSDNPSVQKTVECFNIEFGIGGAAYKLLVNS